MSIRDRLAKLFLPPSIRPAARDLVNLPRRFDAMDAELRDVPARLDVLAAELRQVNERLEQLPGPQLSEEETIRRHEFRAYSQNAEDGILLYLFTMIGTAGRRFAEIGVEDGRECNSANLSLNFGWEGLLVDRDEDDVERARDFYAERLGAESGRVRIVARHVTRENVNETLLEGGLEGEIDLLSIDIDGNDYWVWEALDVVRPRVLVVEYNATLGYELPLVAPYDPDFSRFDEHPSGFYHGASLAALVKLGDSKGYCLVGCESAGVNAFFVRRDTTFGRLKQAPIHLAWKPMYGRMHLGSVAQQFELIKDLPFEAV